MYTEYYPSTRVNPNREWFVKEGPTNRSGLAWSTPRNSIQSAINAAAAGDTIYVAPGSYDEYVKIPFSKPGISLVGVGTKGSIIIAPTNSADEILTVHANNSFIRNIHVFSDGVSGTNAFLATGSGLRVVGCKFEGAANQCLVGPGTLDDIEDETEGAGLDMQFVDCEFSDGTNGFVLKGTDYGPATSIKIQSCLFHDLTNASLTETIGDDGTSANTYRSLWVEDCLFDGLFDGTAPIKWCDLGDNNSNTGVIFNCHFIAAADSGKNIVSTAVKWVGNYYPAGLSIAQPS